MKKPSTTICPLIALLFVGLLFGCGGNGNGIGATGGKTTATTGSTATTGTTATTATTGTTASAGTTGNGVPTYTIEAFPVSSGSAVQSANGVDSAGDVLYTVSGPVGQNFQYPLYAYRYDASTKKSTVISGAGRCGVTGMNDSGIGVGNLGEGTGATQGVVWQAGATSYQVLGAETGWTGT